MHILFFGGRRLCSLALPDTKRVDLWFYVEIERLSSQELLCAVRFYVFVYVYDAICMRGDFARLGEMIGIWLALLALIQRFDWVDGLRNLSPAISDCPIKEARRAFFFVCFC